jgi:hypothetical protein
MSKQVKPIFNTSTPPPQNTHTTNEWYYIGAGFFLFILIASIILVFFGLFYRSSNPGVPCSINTECTSTQICSNGYCADKTCSKNDNCNISIGEICVLGFCNAETCQSSDTCRGGSVCSNVSKVCVPIGYACTSNENCLGGELICATGSTVPVIPGGTGPGVCQQCFVNSDCPNNGPCYQGKCYSSCAISEPNASSGICSSGEVCVNNSCCPQNIGFPTPNQCSATSPCPDSNSYCVDGSCGCRQGNRLQSCLTNNDCASGNCNAGVCLNAGDTCGYNFKGGPINTESITCGADKPYCSNGTCSTIALGSTCSLFRESAGAPTYTACNPYVVPDSDPPASEVYYCVNSVCAAKAGNRGDTCTVTSDCNVGLKYVCVSNVCR